MASKSYILSLYRSMLRESRQFENYNYRMYALRRVRDAFRDNKGVSGTNQIEELVKKAEENLGIIKRQVSIGQMYKAPTTVIENMKGIN